jgi:hypothetical protein
MMDAPQGRREIRSTLSVQVGAVIRLPEQLKRVPQVFPRRFNEWATTRPATPVPAAALLWTAPAIHLTAPLY